MNVPGRFLLTVLALIACGSDARPVDTARQRRDSLVLDSGPSLEQTRAWIAERLPELGTSQIRLGSGGYITVLKSTIQSAALDSACTLQVQGLTESGLLGESSPFAPIIIRSITRVPLQQVDASGVQPTASETPTAESFIKDRVHNVRVPISGGSKVVEYTRDSSGRRQRELASEAMITARDAKAAERIAKGVRRAVELCGGKVDPF